MTTLPGSIYLYLSIMLLGLLCTGCGMCVEVCPYDALSLKDKKAEVNEVLCEGCGTCVATCLRAAIETKNLTPLQIHEMIRASIGG